MRVTFYPNGTRSLICIFLKKEARYLAPLIFDIHGGAHAGRSQEYLMERGEVPASAQINSRWVYRLWKCTFDSSQFHESLRRVFVSNAKRIFIVTLGGIEWLADRDTFLAGPGAQRSSDRRSCYFRKFVRFTIVRRFTVSDPFRARSRRRESPFDRTATICRFVCWPQISGRMASKVLPAEVFVDSIGPSPIYLPQVFQSSRRIVENLLAGEFGGKG